MEDKIFDLLAKLYSDMTEQFKSVKDDIRGLKNDIIRIENDHGQKLDALFDGYKQLYEKQLEHDKQFDKIENKLDNLSIRVTSHDTKLEVLEGGKKK